MLADLRASHVAPPRGDTGNHTARVDIVAHDGPGTHHRPRADPNTREDRRTRPHKDEVPDRGVTEHNGSGSDVRSGAHQRIVLHDGRRVDQGSPAEARTGPYVSMLKDDDAGREGRSGWHRGGESDKGRSAQPGSEHPIENGQAQGAVSDTHGHDSALFSREVESIVIAAQDGYAPRPRGFPGHREEPISASSHHVCDGSRVAAGAEDEPVRHAGAERSAMLDSLSSGTRIARP